MKFTEILEELRKGKKVTREKWETAGDACSVDFIVYNQKNDKCEYCLDGRYDNDFVFVFDDITAEDWKLYKEKKTNKKWKPQYGEKYYTISTRGTIDFDNFVAENNTYASRLLLGNVFETEEEAKHMLEKIKIINKLRELSNAVFDNNIEDLKYSISYDVDTKEVGASMNRFSRLLPFEVYFKTREDCQKAIDTIGEYNLKKYYFDIDEVEEDK